jgi:hypothetical protein
MTAVTRPHRFPPRATAWPLAIACLWLGGCAAGGSFERHAPLAEFVPSNVVADDRLPAEVRRVLVLPLHGGDAAPATTARSLDGVFATALQQQQRFEVVTLSREECLRRFRVESFASTGLLPRDLLAIAAEQWGADAVLFVDLTAFEPNRPLVLGVRAKLALVETGRLLWAFDTVFSSADPAVALGARRHAARDRRGSGPADLDAGVLLSPSRFGGYVAETTFATLPVR